MMHLQRQVFTLLVVALPILSIAAAPVSAEQIVVEAEDFIDSYDIAFNPIEQYTAGIYVTVMGPDYPGEWVEYTLPVAAYGSYSFLMLCWGDDGVTYLFNVYFIPDSGGETQSITASFTGSGCFG
jgi:hypothetical protein